MSTNGKHDFQRSLAMSHSADVLPFWEECYRKAWPTFQGMHNHRDDGQHQRNGIDRSVILNNGKTVWIDEKVRGRNAKTGRVYEDVALEYWSDLERKIEGWVCKPLLADIIAYAIAPLGKCYLLPVQQMQNAWLYYGDEWVARYKYRDVYNTSWTTRFCPVPVAELFKAIGKEFRVEFEPVEWEE